jgi:ATP-binding cassette, subfamily F, member 3
MAQEAVLRFSDVTFNFGLKKPILEEVSMSLRRGTKYTLMGQNGAGKSTIFGLILGEHEAISGSVTTPPGISIAIARQTMPKDKYENTIREYLENCITKGKKGERVYDIDPKAAKILAVVELHLPIDKQIKDLSGGQMARLLLAGALIQNPDILLLDEPTNNLDKKGIEHLTTFLMEYKKTVLVISHDAEFLNAFTDGIFYLDIFTQKLDQYVGNYKKAVEEVKLKIEKDRAKNAQIKKEIQEKKDKVNYFALKGGKMRKLASKLRDEIEESEDDMVDMRKEDKTIRNFVIPTQDNVVGTIAVIDSIEIMKDNKRVSRPIELTLKKKSRILLSGPNGIGKSTLLERLAKGTEVGCKISEGIVVSYYRQDFTHLDFDETPYQHLCKIFKRLDEHKVRSVASSFLITSDIINTPIGKLSEGQKALVAYARIVLEQPGLLIMDEPTNHINFRHLPVIAKALHEYQGALILISHVHEFVKQIKVDQEIKLEKI